MQRHDIPPILVVPLPFVMAVVSFVSHYLSRGFLVVLIIRQFFVGMPGKNRKKIEKFPRLAEAFSIRVAVSYRGHLILCTMKCPRQRSRNKRRG